ncbi:BEL1-like homeodomain protein 9 [Linum grandiflorum]
MRSVVASFEAVAGLGNAAPFIPNAIKIMSFHFTSLKNTLLHRLHCLTTQSDSIHSQSSNTIKPSSTTFNLNFFLQSPPPQQQHPVWRSQRVLPDHAVALLKSWLFEHFLHPYPTDSEKQILAQQTGLSRTQVSNWFINARVRVWKPMVEEIHSLESEQKAVASSSLANIGNKRTRFSEHEDHGGYSSSDGVSLALGLPPRTYVPVNNPPWPFPVDDAAANPSAGNHEFAGGSSSSNHFYGR